MGGAVVCCEKVKKGAKKSFVETATWFYKAGRCIRVHPP